MKKNIFVVILYLAISFGIAMIFLASGQNTSQISSESTKSVTIGIVNSETSGFGAGLEKYIRENFNTTGVGDLSAENDDIREALYSGATTYIIEIDGENIKDYQAPNNTSAYIAQSYINNYVNTYRAIELLRPDASADELAELTVKSLGDVVEVENLGASKSGVENLNNFYNIFVYGVLGTLVMGIGVAMMALNERKLYLRTVMSPVSIRKRNTALFLAQAGFGVAVWLLGALLSLFFAGDALMSPAHIMFIVNSAPFVLSVTAIGFLIGQAVKNETVFSGVSTVLMLCVSFLSGAFIPQQFLAESVLKISALTPAYWFIVNNNKIGQLSNYDWGALAGPMAVMLAFAAILVLAGTAVTVVKARKKFA
jgi:ABC-2 type transport system permease protein